jgi:plasmid stability protein
MRITLDLPDELLRALKARAAMESTTLEELVQRLLRQGVAASERQDTLRTPSRLPAPVRGGRRKMKAYTNADLSALAEALTDR